MRSLSLRPRPRLIPPPPKPPRCPEEEERWIIIIISIIKSINLLFHWARVKPASCNQEEMHLCSWKGLISLLLMCSPLHVTTHSFSIFGLFLHPIHCSSTPCVKKHARQSPFRCRAAAAQLTSCAGVHWAVDPGAHGSEAANGDVGDVPGLWNGQVN